MRQTLRTRQKEKTRKKILSTAAVMFLEKGYAATGVDDIMKKAGLTSGAFYAHFDSKKKLFECTIDDMLVRSRAALLKGTEDLEGDEFRKVFFANYESEARRDRPGLPSLAAELYRESNTSPAKIADHVNHLVDIMTKKQKNIDRKAALLNMARAIGAISLVRMMKGEKLATEILEAIRDPDDSK